MADIKLPELGDGIDGAKVSFWHYDIGENIDAGDDLLEVTTDKATFNVPASVGGVLKEQKFQEGLAIIFGLGMILPWSKPSLACG